MNCYKLFGEWRNRTIYGESLADAILRQSRFQRPDSSPADGARYSRSGATYEEGEYVEVKSIIGQVDVSQSSRGSAPFERIVAELTDGKIVDFDGALVGKVETR